MTAPDPPLPTPVFGPAKPASGPAKPSPDPASGALARLRASLPAGRGPAPVERWDPPDCGAIDMRIAPDGTWFHDGSAIARPALVRLFASVLRRDGAGYVLVTPVEKVAIAVDDLPFAAVEMAVDGDGADRRVAVRTNVDDLVEIGPDHPLRFDTGAGGGAMPAVRVRGDLWARLTRTLAHDLLDLAQEDGAGGYAVVVGGHRYPVPLGEAPARDPET